MTSPQDIPAILQSLLDEAVSARQYLSLVHERLNWIPREAIELAAERFGEPYLDLYQSIAFDPDISMEPRGKHVIEVCRGLACREAGSERISAACLKELGIREEGMTEDGLFTVAVRHCFGRCAIGPNVKVNKSMLAGQTPELVLGALRSIKDGSEA